MNQSNTASIANIKVLQQVLQQVLQISKYGPTPTYIEEYKICFDANFVI